MMSILPINLRDLLYLSGIESARVEFKASWDEKTTGAQVLRTICAFANDFQNLNGGYIVIGVAQEDGAAVLPPQGLAPAAVEAAQNWISKRCKTITPPVHPVLSPEVVDGRHLLVVWMPGSQIRPHQAPEHSERGAARKFYVRVGASTVDAGSQPELMAQLLQLTGRVPFDDRRAPSASVADIRETKVREFLHVIESGLADQPDTKLLYRNLMIAEPVNGHDAPRNVGLLFFSDDPEQWFRGARIEVAQFPDDAAGDIIEEKYFRKKPIHEQLRDCVSWLDGFAVLLIQKSAHRAEAAHSFSYPQLAVREALANAIHHRSYDAMPEPTKVYIYPDRMEIISYPGPVPGIEMAHLLGQAPMPPVQSRNRRVGEFLKELKLAEARGSGMGKIVRAMQKNGSPPPRFDFDPTRSYFRVTLPVHPGHRRLPAATPGVPIEETAAGVAGAIEVVKPGNAAEAAEAAVAMRNKRPELRHMGLHDCEAIPEPHWLSGTLGMPVNFGITENLDSTASPAQSDGQADGQAEPPHTQPAAGGDARHGVEVFPYLLDWIDSADAPPLFVLLGDYGMGKTVTCQKLAAMLDARQRQGGGQGSGQLLPLYFDLRNVTGLDKRVPTLRETLEECMERGWHSAGQGGRTTLDDVLAWMDGGSVAIIDGLDEVLVRLKEHEGQTFTRNLLKLLDEAQAHPTLRGRLRLLLSCRSETFRTLREQQSHVTGQDRGRHGADACRALALLPLTEGQVLGYLRGVAQDGADAQRLLETIRSVPGLQELTQRPATLKLVAEFVPEIERGQGAGRAVQGAALYRRLTRRWLERDSGKHQISPDHKMRLAAHLAAHLWRSGRELLEAGALENWFHAWLEGQPDIRRRYANLHPDQLEQDLRTATFLARQDADGNSAGPSGFRFAHRSLQEFFLADYLLQAVQANRFEDWAMPVPSAATLDFLRQMLDEAAAAGGAVLQTLDQWRKRDCAQASELLATFDGKLAAAMREAGGTVFA